MRCLFVFDSDEAFFFFPGREAHRSENWASILYKLTPTPLSCMIRCACPNWITAVSSILQHVKLC